ncbi:MAG: DUF2202 domain-containing protein [Bryobacteraceae bacterium]
MQRSNTQFGRRELIAALAAGAAAVASAQQRSPGAPGTPINVTPPSAEEIQSLTFMREEEKMARDVYDYLYQRWGITVFDSIAASEEQHFAQVGRLLTRYGIADPAANLAAGVFGNSKLSTLYAELVAKGAASLKDALEVGVAIEQVDIADLEEAIVEASKSDIKRVYTNLMEASYQHLEAFEANLQILAALS